MGYDLDKARTKEQYVLETGKSPCDDLDSFADLSVSVPRKARLVYVDSDLYHKVLKNNASACSVKVVKYTGASFAAAAKKFDNIFYQFAIIKIYVVPNPSSSEFGDYYFVFPSKPPDAK